MHRVLLLIVLSVCVIFHPVVISVHAATEDREVTYCSPNGLDLKMNLYYPVRRMSGQTTSPIVLYLHGGSWTSGSPISGWTIAQFLSDNGFATAAISYRLGPEYQFPSMIEDAKCAIRYLRANAATLHIDPDHIGVIGVSAGGHLAELLGTTGSDSRFEGRGNYANQSSRVQAVIAFYAPSDLTDRVLERSQGRYLSVVFGDLESRKAASPIQYVSDHAAPILLIHGDTDFVVPVTQSISFYDRLKAAGVPAELVVVRNAGHSLKAEGQLQPSLGEVNQIMLHFLARYLKD